MTVEATTPAVDKVYPVPQRLLSGEGVPTPFVSSFDQYKELWEESVNHPNNFFGNVNI
jgi:acetyl-CoA synthetase